MGEVTETPDIPVLETERLILRPLELADAPAVQKTFPQWEIVKHLSSASIPWPYPPDGAMTFIRDIALPAMREGSEWTWSLRPRSGPDALIGLIGLYDTSEANRGFWLAPEWQGKGLMSEAVEVVTDFWFTTLGRPLMRIPKAAPNLASRRISEKTGMRLVETGEKDYVCGRLPMEVWEITREEWLAQKALR
jgi:RimJ/RimL family protein N-acetyltransferase